MSGAIAWADAILRLEHNGADVLPDPEWWPGRLDRKAPGGSWAWSVYTQRWRYPNTGRAVPQAKVSGWLADRQAAIREDMRSLAGRHARGELSRPEFLLGMREQVKGAHIQSQLLAIGGRANAGAGDWGAVGQAVRREYGYLEGFAADIASGKLSEAQIMARAELYANAAVKSTYTEARRRGHQAAGFTHKRRHGPNDGATCSDCADEIAAGWVDIGESGWTIGHTACMANDRCEIEFKREGERGQGDG